MSRNDKIFERLTTLETEFLGGLCQELRDRADGKDAPYLKWYEGELHGIYFHLGRKYLTTHIAQLERLRVEIRKLRLKLGLPASDGPTAILDQYVRDYYAQSPDWKNQGEHLAKQYLRQLGS